MDYKLCDGEYHLMEIVWELEPVTSTDLYKECLPRLGWKKSTTYTTIKKLCEKGYIKNENAVVSVKIPREKVQSQESDYFVERTFSGSLPRFLAAFLGGKKLSRKEAEEIRKMIEEHEE